MLVVDDVCVFWFLLASCKNFSLRPLVEETFGGCLGDVEAVWGVLTLYHRFALTASGGLSGKSIICWKDRLLMHTSVLSP